MGRGWRFGIGGFRGIFVAEIPSFAKASEGPPSSGACLWRAKGDGGGGGSRTPVRGHITNASTCLVRNLISHSKLLQTRYYCASHTKVSAAVGTAATAT